MGRRHKLINNCLSCGRIICELEGEGPCLFCGTSVKAKENISDEIQEQEYLENITKDAQFGEWYYNALESKERLL